MAPQEIPSGGTAKMTQFKNMQRRLILPVSGGLKSAAAQAGPRKVMACGAHGY
jgi:hypothetical protein